MSPPGNVKNNYKLPKATDFLNKDFIHGYEMDTLNILHEHAIDFSEISEVMR